MDPLTVLSLTGNLVQFIDFSIKILVEARAAYDSGAGVTSRVETLREQIETLQVLAARASQPGIDGGETPDEIALARLLNKAKTLAQETIELSNHLKSKNSKSKFGAVFVAVKAHIKKSDLERLEQKAIRCRRDIIERWTMMTSDKQSSTLALLKKDLGELGEANKGIVRTVDDTKTALDEAVKLTRQQMQHDSVTLTAIKESIEKMSRIVTETKELDAIMKRLRFDEIHLRELSIADANQLTFRWLLYSQDDESRQKPSSNSDTDADPNADFSTSNSIQVYKNYGESARVYRETYLESIRRDQKKKRVKARELFLRWLRSDHGLFYISGKPGSGKSTLMKLICSDQKTTEELEVWAADKRLVFARFFFWAAGSEKQRSLEGLYRAILWEALRVCPDIGRDVFPEHWRSYELNTTGRLDDDGFSLAELRAAFERLVTSEKILQRHRICIFIDGLDEYGGDDHWDIAKGLVAWSENPDVKICVSCRPHNEFEHHFGRGNFRKLRLHEHTWQDMVGLIGDKLFGDERFDAFKDQDDYANFENELVGRAEGVFLWLTLAIKDLLDGLSSAYSFSQLKAKLVMIPDAIENIYKRLLYSISPSDRRYASRTFLALLELQKRDWYYNARSDIIFSFLDDLADKDPNSPELYRGTLNPVLTDDEMNRRCQAIKLRVNKRCKGLLQISPGGYFDKSQIFEPIHRTLLEYLNQPEAIAWLEKGAVNFDPHLSLLLCHLQLVRVVVLGASYYKWQGEKPKGSLLDCYRLSRVILSLSSQIWKSMETISNHTLYIRLITTLGDLFGGHFSCFRSLRNSDWLISTSPGVWRRRQFSGLFSGHDDYYETSFSSLAFNSTSNDKWDLVISQTKYGSPIATVNLLLRASSSVSQTMEWNESSAKRGIDLLGFLLRHKLDPNAELPGEPVCIRDLSKYHKKYGDYWTSWTASLFSAVSFISSSEPNPYLVEIIRSFISYGADTKVVLVGYLVEDSNFKGLSDSEPLPHEPDYSGPLYIDVSQLLRLWRVTGLEHLITATAETRGQYVASWIAKMRSSLDFRNAEAEDKIKRLEIDELRTKTLVVLNVVPVQRLSDISVPNLEQLLQSLKEGRQVEFVNML